MVFIFLYLREGQNGLSFLARLPGPFGKLRDQRQTRQKDSSGDPTLRRIGTINKESETNLYRSKCRRGAPK